MATMNRVRVAWSGFPGAPGVTTFYCDNPVSFRVALNDFIGTMRNYFSNQITLTIETEGDIVDDVTGVVEGGWTDTAQFITVGNGSEPFAGPAGFVINWLTGVVMDGRRVRGKTFFVPAVTSIYQNDGSINPTVLAALRSSVNTFVAVVATNMRVWHRPVHATLSGGVRIGGSAHVTSGNVPDLVAVLRSRR